MRFLRSRFKITTRFGGGFVQSINGLEGGGEGGHVDWFFWVNGIESSVGAADYELSPGDHVQWDRRDWSATMRVPAIVGAFPEPFLHGTKGKRPPVRVECDDPGRGPCAEVKRRLERLGVSTSSSTVGAPGTEKVLRVVVAPWKEARLVSAAAALEKGPRSERRVRPLRRRRQLALAARREGEARSPRPAGRGHRASWPPRRIRGVTPCGWSRRSTRRGSRPRRTRSTRAS